MLRVAVFAILVAFASAKSISPKNVEGIEHCPSSGVVLGVRVPGCTRVPCEVFTGTIVVMEADFRASQKGSHVRLLVTTVFLGLPIELTDEIINGNIEPNFEYTIEYTIVEIPDLYAGVTLNLTIELFSQSEVKECCVKAPVKITKP